MVEDKVTARVAMAQEVMVKTPTEVIANNHPTATTATALPKAATDSTQRRERNLKAALLVAATTTTEQFS